MTGQLTFDGRDTRVKTFRNRSCLCDGACGVPCWCARCVTCGETLTKHAFTEEDAHDEAVHALDFDGHFQHHCPRADA